MSERDLISFRDFLQLIRGWYKLVEINLTSGPKIGEYYIITIANKFNFCFGSLNFSAQSGSGIDNLFG